MYTVKYTRLPANRKFTFSHRSRRHRAAAASHIYVTEAPSPVIFIRVQVSHISCDGGALKLSGLLIFKRIKLVASNDSTNKSSALAEMGDRARAKWDENWGAVVPLTVWELGAHLTQCRLGRGYLRTK